MITLGFLHDYRLSEYLGGAQLNVEALVAAAPAGIEVVRCYPGSMKLCDAYVLHNVKRFGQAELRMAMSQPYVKVENDYWDTPQGWQKDWIGPVMNGAQAVIFLSPLHREAFLRQHPGCRPKKTYLVPSPMDPADFIAKVKKPGSVVWLGEWQPHKGIEAACRWAAENGQVTFFGWGPMRPSGPNVNCLGRLPYEMVPDVLARYERFLFLPEWIEPFGRTVAEAVLSGCELVCNDRIGALSWGWETREEWAKGVGTAAERFWEVIGGILL